MKEPLIGSAAVRLPHLRVAPRSDDEADRSLAHPTPIVHVDWSPPFACPTHTALPISWEIKGRRILVVSDEEVGDRLASVLPSREARTREMQPKIL